MGRLVPLHRRAYAGLLSSGFGPKSRGTHKRESRRDQLARQRKLMSGRKSVRLMEWPKLKEYM